MRGNKMGSDGEGYQYPKTVQMGLTALVRDRRTYIVRYIMMVGRSANLSPIRNKRDPPSSNAWR